METQYIVAPSSRICGVVIWHIRNLFLCLAQKRGTRIRITFDNSVRVKVTSNGKPIYAYNMPFNFDYLRIRLHFTERATVLSFLIKVPNIILYALENIGE